MKPTRALLVHAEHALARMLDFSAPADQVLSTYFRRNPVLGKADRGFIAETCYAALRRRRSLAAAAGNDSARALVLAALLRVLGISARALEPLLEAGEVAGLAQVKAWKTADAPDAVRAELPDWLWQKLSDEHGEEPAMALAQSLLQSAPLDLRVNLARVSRDEALERLREEGFAGEASRLSPAGIRLVGKPAINHSKLFDAGLVEVQDEGSQLLAWLLAPRRGEWVADFCAGAGGKTLAIASLMRGTGRIYALDISAPRLRELGPRAARAAVSNVHPIVIDSENDLRVKRLAGKLHRVLVDAPCSGFGTLRRNPDLKWRHTPQAIDELSAKQQRILLAAARLLRPGGRLVYATCSILRAENEAVVERFSVAQPEFEALDCGEILAGQRIPGLDGKTLHLWPQAHGTDGFFAAAFRRRGAAGEEVKDGPGEIGELPPDQ